MLSATGGEEGVGRVVSATRFERKDTEPNRYGGMGRGGKLCNILS